MNKPILLSVIFFAAIFYACHGNKGAVPGGNEAAGVPDLHEAHQYSIIISKGGRLVEEQYFKGRSKDSLCDVQSLTKSLISILTGIAIDKGYLKSVDEPIYKYFEAEFAGLGEKKRSISIRHLLNQTSGLEWKGYPEHEEWLNSEDPVSFVLNKPMSAKAGEIYNYNSGATHLLSVIISKASRKSTLQFAEDELFTALGIGPVDWQLRPKGYYDGSGLGLSMRPIDLLKIGHLIAAGGKWQGRQIVSESWLEKMLEDKEKKPTAWGLEGSRHGYCWYKADFRDLEINYGMGYGGQFIILIPEKELVIVTTHDHDTPDGIRHQMDFLYKKLPQIIARFE